MIETVFAILNLVQQNQNVLSTGLANVSRPGIVDIERVKASAPDAAREILNCYHRTARFQTVDIANTPFERQLQYGADRSAILRIRYVGITRQQYTMIVALMAKENTFRTAVIQDNATIPYAKSCQLENWTSS